MISENSGLRLIVLGAWPCSGNIQIGLFLLNRHVPYLLNKDVLILLNDEINMQDPVKALPQGREGNTKDFAASFPRGEGFTARA